MFGPTTTTRHVYDVAAQHVVSGAMEGVNGNFFLSGFIILAFHIRNKWPFCLKAMVPEFVNAKLCIGRQFTTMPLT